MIFRAHANRYFGSTIIEAKGVETKIIGVILFYFVKGISEPVVVTVSEEAYELPLEVVSHALSVLLVLIFNQALEVLHICFGIFCDRGLFNLPQVFHKI